MDYPEHPGLVICWLWILRGRGLLGACSSLPCVAHVTIFAVRRQRGFCAFYTPLTRGSWVRVKAAPAYVAKASPREQATAQ